MTNGRDTLSKSETVTIAAIEQGIPLLVEAREIIAGFRAMIRKKAHGELESSLERACASLVVSFANGVIKDKAPVSAAISDVLVQRRDRRPDRQTPNWVKPQCRGMEGVKLPAALALLLRADLRGLRRKGPRWMLVALQTAGILNEMFNWFREVAKHWPERRRSLEVVA
ncbi:hypothetical protein [Bradyrhizobium canariense]|uniref:hypothetical protein n=1 Tax=Bradyrhizobium canariense TaxID=255045 RepID=UPI001CA5A331|nr:hypothetical protein [Bradyrhizobium canariense]